MVLVVVDKNAELVGTFVVCEVVALKKLNKKIIYLYVNKMQGSLVVSHQLRSVQGVCCVKSHANFNVALGNCITRKLIIYHTRLFYHTRKSMRHSTKKFENSEKNKINFNLFLMLLILHF